MQKVNFDYEILIHDDASNDETAKIIGDYSQKFPNIVRPIFQVENQYSKGKNILKEFIFKNIRGEYVAFCEGDDYWVDDRKLQKQVDFLDENKDCTICFHPVKVIWENNKDKENDIFPLDIFRDIAMQLTFDRLKSVNFIQTNSVVYRWVLKGKENLFPDNILPGDWFLHLLHAREGKICLLNDVMAVYRRHSDSLWDNKNFYLRNGVQHLRFFMAVEKEFSYRNEVLINDVAIKTFSELLKNRSFEKIKSLFCEFSDLSDIIINNLMVNRISHDDNQKLKLKKKKRRRKRLIVILLFLILFFLDLYLLFVCFG